jgi:hypothetical protein
MSNLADFLNEKGITPDALAAQSKAMEAYNTNDRDLMVQRAAARRAKKTYQEAEVPKPAKFGRGVTLRTLNDALKGASITKAGRKKITRAVNAMLSSKKEDAVELSQLFADAPARKGKKK